MVNNELRIIIPYFYFRHKSTQKRVLSIVK